MIGKFCSPEINNSQVSERGVNRFSDQRIWPLKSVWIVDFWRKSSRFVDFENTVDRGSAVNFGADFGFCLP